MRLVSNSVDPTSVQDNGDHYLIQDVPFVRPMELAGGYVPEANIKNTTQGWDGVPATLNHPRDESGTPVAANQKPGTHIGSVENPTYDGSHVRADIRLSKNRLESLGGEAHDIQTALESGQEIDVSSQYRPEPLPPGQYDGSFRENVEAIKAPDSVAILPNKPGQCSIEDGCGINPAVVANADIRVTAADDAVSPESGPAEGATVTGNKQVDGIEYDDTKGGDLDESEIPTDDYESHYVFPADTKSASSFPLVDADGNLRKENVAAAFRFRSDAPDVDKLLSVLGAVNREFDDPPIDPESLEDAMSANAGLIGSVASFLGLVSDGETTGAESPADTKTETTTDMSDLQDESMIEELAANTEFDRENLEEWDGEDCLQRLHSEYVEANNNDNGDDPDDPTGDDPDVTGNTTEEVVLTESELEAKIDERAQEIVANREAESQKESLASEIVANSAEYDDTESVLEDYTTVPALKTKKEQVRSGSVLPGGNGQTANALETDGIEVSSGVFD